MAEYTASGVADAIIAFCCEHGDYVSNLKLQKMLYYVQGWHLALYDRPLFDDQFQAWIHGPVVPSVYRQYKDFGYRPITPSAPIQFEDVQTHLRDHIADVWIPYGGRSAYELEVMTHNEMPWLHARQGLPPDAPSQNIITRADMTEFFKSQM